jgi:predicted Zn-ribbon and HTH transcriptional regulator
MVSKFISKVRNNVIESELKVSSRLKPKNVGEYVSELKINDNIEKRLNRLEEQIQEIQNSLILNIPIKRKPKGILIRCDKCGYAWYFTGLKRIARCNNCNARVNVNESVVKEENGNTP